jgi:hypothetical protein
MTKVKVRLGKNAYAEPAPFAIQRSPMFAIRPLAVSLAILAAPLAAEEISGPALLDSLSNRTFDCLQGPIPLQWSFETIALDATAVPYVAIVKGKTVEAEYEITSNGRLTSDGYGAERIVERLKDGALRVTRSDGRAMVCKAR